MRRTIFAHFPEQFKAANGSAVLKRTNALRRMRSARLKFMEAWVDWLACELSDPEIVREFTRTECLLAETSGVFSA